MSKKEKEIEEKKPLLLISTDWHLDKNNTEVISDLIIQKCELAVKLGVPGIFILGDIFDSRKGQELMVLNTFMEILEVITKEYDLYVTILPGNHDKVSYSGESSYAAPFQYMEKVLYVKDYFMFKGYGEEKDTNIYVLPFFSEETWLRYYNEMLETFPLSKTKKNILLTHTAFSNSINNDGSKVEGSSINYSLLKDWDLVLSGHYHDFQQPFKNTYHIPSIRQKNFGENDNKGFTVVNTDLSLDIRVAEFPRFKTYKIDLSNTSLSEVKEMLLEPSPYSNKRVILEGPIELVQAFDSKELEAMGISVKKKNPEIDYSMEVVEESAEIEELTQDKILELFEEFCEKEGLDFGDGVQYLKEPLR